MIFTLPGMCAHMLLANAVPCLMTPCCLQSWAKRWTRLNLHAKQPCILFPEPSASAPLLSYCPFAVVCKRWSVLLWVNVKQHIIAVFFLYETLHGISPANFCSQWPTSAIIELMFCGLLLLLVKVKDCGHCKRKTTLGKDCSHGKEGLRWLKIAVMVKRNVVIRQGTGCEQWSWVLKSVTLYAQPSTMTSPLRGFVVLLTPLLLRNNSY